MIQRQLIELADQLKHLESKVRRHSIKLNPTLLDDDSYDEHDTQL
jgi:hypothetical protein